MEQYDPVLYNEIAEALKGLGKSTCLRCGKPIVKNFSGYCSENCYNLAYTQYLAKPRKCHDCGAPTADYRCEACQKAWRKRHHVCSYEVAAIEDPRKGRNTSKKKRK